ncbi:MAG: thymidylate kinase [Bacteroidota bacterium]
MENPTVNVKRFYGKGLPGLELSQLGGKLIVIEGADGSGRSTQIELLKTWLERRGYPTVDVGLKRSNLVGKELAAAQQGNMLGHITLSLFYATDFADQLENQIIPALRAGFVVLADRYIYTLIARDIVRGADVQWVRELYSIALIPDIVFYLRVSPQILIERNLQKKSQLDYWESGMDIGFSRDMFESFKKYQRLMERQFQLVQKEFGFEVVNGSRRPRAIFQEIQSKVELILNGDKQLIEQRGATAEHEPPA